MTDKKKILKIAIDLIDHIERFTRQARRRLTNEMLVNSSSSSSSASLSSSSLSEEEDIGSKTKRILNFDYSDPVEEPKLIMKRAREPIINLVEEEEEEEDDPEDDSFVVSDAASPIKYDARYEKKWNQKHLIAPLPRLRKRTKTSPLNISADYYSSDKDRGEVVADEPLPVSKTDRVEISSALEVLQTAGWHAFAETAWGRPIVDTIMQIIQNRTTDTKVKSALKAYNILFRSFPATTEVPRDNIQKRICYLCKLHRSCAYQIQTKAQSHGIGSDCNRVYMAIHKLYYMLCRYNADNIINVDAFKRDVEDAIAAIQTAASKEKE